MSSDQSERSQSLKPENPQKDPAESLIDRAKKHPIIVAIVVAGGIAGVIAPSISSIRNLWNEILLISCGVPPPPKACSAKGMVGTWDCHGKCDPTGKPYSKLFFESDKLRWRDGKDNEGTVTIDFSTRTITVKFDNGGVVGGTVDNGAKCDRITFPAFGNYSTKSP